MYFYKKEISNQNEKNVKNSVCVKKVQKALKNVKIFLYAKFKQWCIFG